MKFSDKDIAALLSKYVLSYDQETEAERARRRKAHERWAEWINPGALESLTDAQLTERFLEYFNSGAERVSFRPMHRDMIITDKSKFRRTLRYLLDERIPVEQRLGQILNPSNAYHIKGLGKGLATSFLEDLNPDKYCTWNNKTDLGLKVIGLYPTFNRGDDLGQKYQVILGILTHIKSLRPGLSFLDINYFVHIVWKEQNDIITIGTDQASEAYESEMENKIPGLLPTDVKDAIEKYAVAKAKEKYKSFRPEESHRHRPYDLTYTSEGTEYYIEVKGTQRHGPVVVVFLTPNEVRHARDSGGKSILFIFHSVHVKGINGKPEVSGGKEHEERPWEIDDKYLKPILYQYAVPTHESVNQ